MPFDRGRPVHSGTAMPCGRGRSRAIDRPWRTCVRLRPHVPPPLPPLHAAEARRGHLRRLRDRNRGRDLQRRHRRPGRSRSRLRHLPDAQSRVGPAARRRSPDRAARGLRREQPLSQRPHSRHAGIPRRGRHLHGAHPGPHRDKGSRRDPVGRRARPAAPPGGAGAATRGSSSSRCPASASSSPS